MKWFLKNCLRLLAISALVALGAALPSGAQVQRVAAQQAAGPIYLVQEGDTLYGIALNFGVTLAALQAANPALSAATLSVGAAVVIPGLPDLTGTLATYRLTPGETLDSVALRFGLRRSTLLRLNRFINPERLYINEPLIRLAEPDASHPLTNSVAYALTPETSLLALAAAHNQNPWAVAAANQLPHPNAVITDLVYLPGGEYPTKALPYPLREVSLTPFPILQGQTVALKVVTAAPVTLTGQLHRWPLHFFAETPNTYIALQGVHRFTEANLYPFTLQATNGVQTWQLAQTVPIRTGDYLTDLPLTVDPATVDPANTKPEEELIFSVISPTTTARWWSGAWVYPSVGQFRSMYGSLRSYNGGPYNFFHTGVDFSGGDDRPITAPAPGVVVYTGPLTVRGNVTLIDHGWGVFTGYWHQSQIVVNVGDHVETGQILGYNGSTGRVTGPHLHWELFVGGVQVNPLQWTEVVFP